MRLKDTHECLADHPMNWGKGLDFKYNSCTFTITIWIKTVESEEGKGSGALGPLRLGIITYFTMISIVVCLVSFCGISIFDMGPHRVDQVTGSVQFC
jgi:hypothetical protein